MKVVKKELKEVFEPFKLEVTELNNDSDITYKEDSSIIEPVYSTLRSVLKKEYSGASLSCYAWASPILK